MVNMGNFTVKTTGGIEKFKEIEGKFVPIEDAGNSLEGFRHINY